MSTDQGLLEQAKEKLCDAYDATLEAASNLHEKIVGEKSTEDKAADALKDKVDKGADLAKDAHDKFDEKKEDAKDCAQHYKNCAGDKLHKAGNRLQSSR